MTLGERIKENRKRCNLTQEELAKMMDTSKQTIYKYETGAVTNIPLWRISEMARIFNISEKALMGWEEEKKPEVPDTFHFDLPMETAALVMAYNGSPEIIKDCVWRILDIPRPRKKED